MAREFDLQLVLRMIGEGKTVNEIRAVYGLSTFSPIRSALRRAGLYHRRKRTASRNLKGFRFGKWLVLRRFKPRKLLSRRTVWWLCRCDCGTKKPVDGEKLTSGKSKRCFRCRNAAITKHGMHGSGTYRSYWAMLGRCKYSDRASWNNYGGRGITVCERWQGTDGFDNFLSDMGQRPRNKTLDRKNVNGNYTPDNCRWATRKQQAKNRRPRCVESVEELAAAAGFGD